MLSCVELWQAIVAILSGIVTTVAILVAGGWTYLLYVRQRLRFPRINPQLKVRGVTLPGDKRLVHAEIRLENSGSVVVRGKRAELRLRQVVPLPKEVDELVRQGFDPVPEGRAEIEWPMLAGREWKWDEGEFEIEPGEPDSLHADFFIDESVKVVEFYFFLANDGKKPQRIGWTLTEIWHCQ